MTFASRRAADLAGLDESTTCGASQTCVAALLDAGRELLAQGQTPNVEEAAELMRWSALLLLRAALAEHDG